MKYGRVYLIALVFSIVGIMGYVFMQGQLDRIRPSREQLKEKLIYIPDSKYIRTASLGYHAPLSDILWARAVIYFGGHYLVDKDYSWLYRIIDAVTTLDTRNILAYRFGGTLLALGQNDVEKSNLLLKKGIRYNPDADWRLYFLLGFNYFYYIGDYVTAAEYLKKASSMPGHPSYLPRLAARMYAKAERMDMAIDFLEKTYHQYDDEKIKATIEERLNVLIAKKYAKSLKFPVEEYKKAHGKYPENLEELVESGQIDKKPKFSGGQFVINQNTGEVSWVSVSSPQWP
jgi:tetratricopeptide (TPR) repeat protein